MLTCITVAGLHWLMYIHNENVEDMFPVNSIIYVDTEDQRRTVVSIINRRLTFNVTFEEFLSALSSCDIDE